MEATARFSAVVAAAGQPEIYLPLGDPKRDRNFQRAVREDRVLSIKQQPTGTKKDFGTVGFLQEKHVTYLVFPKSLQKFADKRVVGIKYEALQQADVSAPHAAKRNQTPRTKAPPPKPPQSARFTATVRLTATNEIKVTVQAKNQKEAKAKAIEVAREQGDLSSAKVETQLLRVRKESTATG